MDPRPFPRVLLPLALAGVAAVAFLWLGVWQLHRLQWKTALIARVEARIAEAPVALPEPARWPALRAEADEYRRLGFSGQWESGLMWVHAGSRAGWGYWVMRALRVGDAQGARNAAHPLHVWVNLGFVPEGERAKVEPALQDAALHPVAGVGLLRWSEHAPLLRHNNPGAGLWYSRDVAAMTGAAGLDAGTTAPWYIDAQSMDPPAAGVEAGLTVVRFNNHHAMYALTWFALAVLSGVAGWIAFKFSRAHESTDVRQGPSARQ